MLRHALITLYPWDVLEGDVGELLDRLQGEIGATGVSLWTGCPPVAHLRSRDLAPRLIRSPGGIFFRPDAKFDEGAISVRSVVDDAAGNRDPLRILADACRARRMELRAKFSCALLGGLAARHPSAATVGVFDDPSLNSVCLANPEVQRFWSDLAANLSSTVDLSALELSDCVIAWHEAAGGARTAFPMDESQRVLLSTCFCRSCDAGGRAAGVDVSAAKRVVRTLLSTALEDPLARTPRLDAVLADNAALRSYFGWRASELGSFLRMMMTASQREVLLDRTFQPTETRQHSAAVLATPASVISRIDRVVQIDSIVSPGVKRYELRVPASQTIGANGAELVSALSQAAARGVSGIQFDTYGLLPECGLTVARQAIRYARRATQM